MLAVLLLAHGFPGKVTHTLSEELGADAIQEEDYDDYKEDPAVLQQIEHHELLIALQQLRSISLPTDHDTVCQRLLWEKQKNGGRLPTWLLSAWEQGQPGSRGDGVLMHRGDWQRYNCDDFARIEYMKQHVTDCKRWKCKYDVVPGRDWGRLSAERRRKWAQYGCDTVFRDRWYNDVPRDAVNLWAGVKTTGAPVSDLFAEDRCECLETVLAKHRKKVWHATWDAGNCPNPITSYTALYENLMAYPKWVRQYEMDKRTSYMV